MLSRYVSLTILILLLVVLGIMFFQVVIPFLLPLFLAAVVALIANPVYLYFLDRTRNRPSLAAGLATTSLMAAVVVPMFVAVTVGALQLYALSEQDATQRTIEIIMDGEIFEIAVRKLEMFFPLTEIDENDLSAEQLDVLRDERRQQRAEYWQNSFHHTFRQLAVSTLSAGTAFSTVDIIAKLGWSLMSLFTFIIALYYFFFEGPKLLEHAIELIPVNVDHQRTLFDEFAKAIRAVVTATLLAAVAQGVATSVALWMLGFGHFFLFTIIATVAALIPLAGTWLVWLPCAISLIYSGDWGWALLLSVYGMAFVATLDNIIRAYVLHSDAKLHPLLAFVSVLGGLQVMGLWGVFIAPVIASCLYALLKIFNEELIELNKDQKAKSETVPVKQLNDAKTE